MKDKVIELQKEQPETRAETFSMVVNSYNPGSGEAGKWREEFKVSLGYTLRNSEVNKSQSPETSDKKLKTVRKNLYLVLAQGTKTSSRDQYGELPVPNSGSEIYSCPDNRTTTPQSSGQAVEIPPFKNNDSHLLSALYLRRTCLGAVLCFLSSSEQI